MSIRSSGTWCDVCNEPVLFGPYQQFKVTISPTPMGACKTCAPLMKGDIDFKALPEGPVKDLFRRAVAEGILDAKAIQ